MLKNVEISSLFGIYDYSFDLNPEESFCSFITGPNGYGKTTILKLLWLLHVDLIKQVSSIPFKSLKLTYDNEDQIIIDKKNIYKRREELREFFKRYPIRLLQTRNPIILTSDAEGYFELVNDSLRSNRNTEDFEIRLNLLIDIINDYKFSHKNLIISENLDLSFVDYNKNKVEFSNLSTGEQSIFIQIFEFLFVVPNNCLVLVDEPEYSLHIAWQIDYLKNLRKISKIRQGLQFIIATHSPQIFDSCWDLTNDLYEQTQEKKEVE